MMPPVVARPKAWVAWSRSAHVAPPSARAVRRSGSTRDAAHPGEVADDPAVVRAEAGHAVGASAHGEVEPLLAGEADGGDDVGDVGAADDRGGPAVDHRRCRPSGPRRTPGPRDRRARRAGSRAARPRSRSRSRCRPWSARSLPSWAPSQIVRSRGCRYSRGGVLGPFRQPAAARSRSRWSAARCSSGLAPCRRATSRAVEKCASASARAPPAARMSSPMSTWSSASSWRWAVGSVSSSASAIASRARVQAPRVEADACEQREAVGLIEAPAAAAVGVQACRGCCRSPRRCARRRRASSRAGSSPIGWRKPRRCSSASVVSPLAPAPGRGRRRRRSIASHVVNVSA